MTHPLSLPKFLRKSWSLVALVATTALALTGCMSTTTSSGPYHVDAYAASTPQAVTVYVSLKAAMIYVMEGDKALLVTPCSVGTPDHPTPTGHFKVTEKIPNKRSGEYGFWTNGSNTVSGEAGHSPGTGYSYIGYPMADWVGFTPGYGFHEGYVWPVPRSHGCLRIHQNAIRKFYQLVQVGTPVIIAQTQPYDDTLGKNAVHPTDYKDPDPPASVLISPDFFKQQWDDQLISTSPAPAATH